MCRLQASLVGYQAGKCCNISFMNQRQASTQVEKLNLKADKTSCHSVFLLRKEVENFILLSKKGHEHFIDKSAWEVRVTKDISPRFVRASLPDSTFFEHLKVWYRTPAGKLRSHESWVVSREDRRVSMVRFQDMSFFNCFCLVSERESLL